MNIETTHTTAKDFFLYAGWIITLYANIISLLTFIFSCINLVYPPLYFDSTYGNSSIITAVSVLIVMFPVFIILSKIIYKDIDKNPIKKDIWIRRWALYLTIFALGLTLAITIITLINTFLNGDLAMGFALKVIATILIAGGAISFYIQDIRGFFIGKSKQRNLISITTSFLVVVAVIGGIIIVGSPAERRAQEFDSQRINDLSLIQSNVLEFWRTQEELPKDLEDLENPLQYFQIPVDPKTGTSYVYNPTGEYSFELCANFDTESLTSPQTDRRSFEPIRKFDSNIIEEGNWGHGIGTQCFDRTIDPERFPAYDN